MRNIPALAALLWLAATPPSMSGAWLREEGDAALAFSHELSQDPDRGGEWGYSTVYGEYGMRPWLTLGLDAGKGENDGDWQALLFVRSGHDFARLPGRVAVELGLGATGLAGGGKEALLRPGLSWGMDRDTGLGPAWVNLDARREYREHSGTARDKLDLTVGLKPGARTMLTMELRAEEPPEGDETLRLAPMVHRRFGDGVWLGVGGLVGVQNDDSQGLVLGTRLEF